MRKTPSLGEQEMALLKYISEQAPVSVRELAAHFEKERGLARTTVLTMTERLRKKGFLSRAKFDGIFQYSAKFETGDVMTGKVGEFIERTLGGSLSPLFNYFLTNKDLTKDELEQLKKMAAKLERKGE